MERVEKLREVGKVFTEFCKDNNIPENKAGYLLGVFVKNINNFVEPCVDTEIIKDAVDYGFKYASESQHDGYVPEGNILQWYSTRLGKF